MSDFYNFYPYHESEQARTIKPYVFSPGQSGPAAGTSYGAPWSIGTYYDTGHPGPVGIGLEFQKREIPLLQKCGSCPSVPHGIIIDCTLPQGYTPKYTDCIMSGRHYLLRNYSGQQATSQLANLEGFPFADQSVANANQVGSESAGPPCQWIEVACVPQWKWDMVTRSPVLWNNPSIIPSRNFTQSGYGDQLWQPGWVAAMLEWGPRLGFDLGFNRAITRITQDPSSDNGYRVDEIHDHSWTITTRGLHFSMPIDPSGLVPGDIPLFDDASEVGKYIYLVVNPTAPYGANLVGFPLLRGTAVYKCCESNLWGNASSSQGVGTATTTFTNNVIWPNWDVIGYPIGSFGHPHTKTLEAISWHQ